MLYILSLQYALDIKPGLRMNIDYCFILKENNLQMRKKIWENYASTIPDFHLFCKIMDKITGDYTALVINNTTQSNDFMDNIFYYKPDIPPSNFKLGCNYFWNFHHNRYDYTKNHY